MKKKLLLLSLLPLIANADDKLADDPTRVVTTVGVSYVTDFSEGDVKFNGSLALDPIRKLNVTINSDASEWRLGGSWLFDLGIVNFNFGKSTYDNDASQTSYSVGTFIPLSFFDIAPFDIQIFPMAGYTYNEGELACDTSVDNRCKNESSELTPEYVLLPSSSHGGYVGGFALRPFTDHWTAIAFAGASMGSNDYSGYWIGGGLSYTFSEKQSFSLIAYTSDNTYGSDTLISAGYKYVFGGL